MPPKRGRTGPAAIAEIPTLKRAKTEKIALVPEEQQIFKGCVFCFIRPNTVSAERRARMKKAMEYGGLCVIILDDQVTHIVVDKDLQYKDILTLLNIDELRPNLILVDQKYTGDCIGYRRLLDPLQTMYMVKGAPELVEEQHEEVEQLPGRVSTQDGDETEDELELPELKLVGEPESSSPPPVFSSDVVAGTSSSSGISSRFPPTRLPKYSSPASSVTPTSSREASFEEQDKGTGSAELDQIIKAMTEEDSVNINQFLDYDDDEGSTLAEGDEESDYDSDAAEAAKRYGKNKSSKLDTTKNEDWQETFQCMKKNDGKLSVDNPNLRTIQILTEMEKEYSTQGDHWRTLGYRKAVASLKKQSVKISTYDQAIALGGIGHRLAEKIVEIVTTDRLQRLEFAKMEPGDRLIKMFTKIYGVGYTTAQKFVNAGYKSLTDVATKAKLSEAQKNGLKHYDDFQIRIPRDEVTEHYRIVEKAAAKIDKDVVTHVMGSYRRKAPDCGDIDIIITRAGGTSQSLKTFLQQLIEDLTTSGFLLCGLALPGRESASKWYGASRVGDDGIARRIDFLIVPEAEIGAALIYFTGDDIFNRSLRLLASKKGMRLNQRGLFKDVIRGKGREHLNEGTLIEGYSETKIFSILGVPYRRPWERKCG